MEFKKKVIGIVVVALLVVTAIAGGMMLYTGNNTAKLIGTKMAPVVEKQAQETVMAYATAIATEFQGFFHTVESLGSATKGSVELSLKQLQLEGIDFGDPGYADKLRPLLMEHFAIIASSESTLSTVYFGDANGNMFIYPKQEIPQGYDPRVRPWYQEAVKNNGPTWSEPYQDASTGKWVITYAVPVYYNGKLVGVVGLDVFIDTLTKRIDEVTIGNTGYVTVAGPNGMTYMHPNHDYIMKLNVFDEPALKPVADIIRSGKDKDVVTYTFNGVQAVAAGVKIPSTGWYVFAKVPVSEVSAGVIKVINDTKETTARSAFLLSILILVISAALIGVSYKMVSDSLKPLEKLRSVAQALAEGRLSEVNRQLNQIHYIEDDEIGALIRAFEAVGKDLVGTLNAIGEKLERLAEGDLSN
ncbi:cache domain-containing protein, partial [Thermococcus sp. 21S7]|uniref:cache domain-containing protein n=1 Tax=Thermococcus sp. 21S7 TaxID=1638221 RepID=UPI00143B5BB9|nr:HAMP domain-containing protein [Thermococcus sp. 21S7]